MKLLLGFIQKKKLKKPDFPKATSDNGRVISGYFTNLEVNFVTNWGKLCIDFRTISN